MPVNQPGQYCRAAEVEYLRSLRDLYLFRRAYLDDSRSFNQDDLLLAKFARLGVEHASGPNGEPLVGSSLRRRERWGRRRWGFLRQQETATQSQSCDSDVKQRSKPNRSKLHCPSAAA